MRSEVRPPLTVEETGPHFNHCHISDIWNNMSGSGDKVGLVGSDWLGLGQGGLGGVSGWVRLGWGWVRVGWVRAGSHLISPKVT